MSSDRKGFTLVEALVAAVLAGVGVAATLNGLAHLTKTQALITEKERMIRLAMGKYDELAALGEATNIGGPFESPEFDRYVWEAQVDTTGVENLTRLTVTVKLNGEQQREASEEVTGLIYEAPIATGGTLQ